MNRSLLTLSLAVLLAATQQAAAQWPAGTLARTPARARARWVILHRSRSSKLTGTSKGGSLPKMAGR